MADIEVYKAIVDVTAAMSAEGIAKNRKNQQQGYAFRGIDDIYGALSRKLANAKLCIIPRIVSRNVVERTTAKGGVLFYVTVEAEFDLVSALDGSAHTARAFGEAMDSADKATNKAMSAAYKYMAMQVFCIPTEGDNDADAVTHEVIPQQQAVKPFNAEAARARIAAHAAATPEDITKAATLTDRDSLLALYREIDTRTARAA